MSDIFICRLFIAPNPTPGGMFGNFFIFVVYAGYFNLVLCQLSAKLFSIFLSEFPPRYISTAWSVFVYLFLIVKVACCIS